VDHRSPSIPVQLVATSGGASSPAWDRLSQIAQQRKAKADAPN
jgi:hypothetical protein